MEATNGTTAVEEMVDAPQVEGDPNVGGPTEDAPTPEAIIAKAEQAVVVPPTEEELKAKADAVFAYERNHKIVPQVFSKRTSSRPLCAGCAFGIRRETEPKYVDGLPYHPNCMKATLDPAFALKLSPRYLAAAAPVMTKVAVAKYNEEPTEDAEEPTEDAAPEAIEDETTDHVQEAVAKSRRRKSA